MSSSTNWTFLKNLLNEANAPEPTTNDADTQTSNFVAISPKSSDVTSSLGKIRHTHNIPLIYSESDKDNRFIAPNTDNTKRAMKELEAIGDVEPISDEDAAKFMTTALEKMANTVNKVKGFAGTEMLDNVSDAKNVISNAVAASNMDKNKRIELKHEIQKVSSAIYDKQKHFLESANGQYQKATDEDLISMFDAISNIKSTDDRHQVKNEVEANKKVLSNEIAKRNINVNDVKKKQFAERVQKVQESVANGEMTTGEIIAQMTKLDNELEINKQYFSNEEYDLAKQGIKDLGETDVAVAQVVEDKRSGKDRAHDVNGDEQQQGAGGGKPNPTNAPNPPYNQNKVDPKDRKTTVVKPFDATEAFEYTQAVDIPIGETVVLDFNDLKSHDVRKVASFLAKTVRMMRNIWGYEPEGYITSTINKYQPTRDFVGSGLQAASRNSIGVLLGIARMPTQGKAGFLKGMETGEEIGEAIKMDMLQNPEDVNPKLVKFENWVRNMAGGKKDVVDVRPGEAVHAAKKQERKNATDLLNRTTRKTNESLVNEEAVVSGSAFALPDSMGQQGPVIFPDTNGKTGSADTFTTLSKPRINVLKGLNLKYKSSKEEDEDKKKVNEAISNIQPTKELVDYVKDRVMELLTSPSFGLYSEEENVKRDWMPLSDSSFPEYIRLYPSKQENYERYKVGGINDYYAEGKSDVSNRPLDVTITLHEKQPIMSGDKVKEYMVSYKINVDKKGSLIQ